LQVTKGGLRTRTKVEALRTTEQRERRIGIACGWGATSIIIEKKSV